MLYPKPSLVEISPEMPHEGSLPDRLYDELKRRILSGLIQPSARLVEKNLCADLKVSRTPLREALNRLSNEDLVIFQPNRGYIAAPLTAETYRQVYDLRKIVEGKVAALAAIRATKDQITQMRAAAPMPEIIPGDDASFIEFSRANARFHLLVARSTGNQLLENIVMSALDHYQRPAYIGIGRAEDASKPTKCHVDLVDAIEDRDPIKAEVVMCSHVIGGSERIIKALLERHA